MRNVLFLFASLMVALVSGTARAQPLADKVPGDALLYVGWAGTDSLGDDYAKTRWAAVLAESRWRELFGPYLDAIEAKIVAQEPEAKQAFAIARTFGGAGWTHPTAVVVRAGADTRSPPRLLVVMNAGADAAKVKGQIDELIARASPRERRMFKVSVKEGLVGFAIDPSGADPLAAVEAPLGKSEAFAGALRDLHPSPMMVAYADIAGTLSAAESAIRDNQPESLEKFRKPVDAFGLSGAKRFVLASGFDGREWRDEAFLESPAHERKGLLAALGEGTLNEKLLGIIPADATVAVVGKFDLGKFVAGIRAGVSTIADPSDVDRAFQQLDGMLGVSVERDVLAPLGQDWALYTSPTTSGNGLLGFALVNQLADPAAAQKGLLGAAQGLTNTINALLKQNRAPVVINGQLAKIGGVDVYYLGLPILAPSWAIDDGRLYVGLYPQTVAAAVKKTRAGGPGIATTEKFKAQLARLGAPKPLSGVSFLDLPEHARTGGGYGQVMVVLRLFGIGDLFGAPQPEPLLPTLDVLQAQLTPAVSGSWFDERGLHVRQVQPFPGSTMLLDQGSGYATLMQFQQQATMMSVLLPSLNRARETANRVKSLSNLKQMGVAVRIYETQNNGKYPPDLKSLAEATDLPGELFINPRTGKQIPAGLRGEERLNWAIENADYVYIGGKFNSRTATAETIIAYENPETVDEGVNVLFGDGHAEWMHPAAFHQELAKQQGEGGGGL